MPRAVLALLSSAVACSGELTAVSGTRLQFRLSSVDMRPVGAQLMSIGVQGWTKLGVKDEPDLPVIRSAVVLPHEQGRWKAVVSDAQKTVRSLEGRLVEPSTGPVSICATAQAPRANFSGPAYHGVYPQRDSVSLGEPYTWRDVYGAVVEVMPVTVDHAAGTMEILHSCTIDIVSTETAPPTAAKVVDQDFYGAYSFVYANFDHFADMFTPSKTMGRNLVLYDSQFEKQANTYADFVKKQWSQETIVKEAGSSSSAVQKSISKHYKESGGLAYVTIIGRKVPTVTGSKSRAECDNCYGLGKGTGSGSTLDLFIGRLSGASAGDINTQINKAKAYAAHAKAAWDEKAYGSCYPAPWDPKGYETLFKDMMKELGGMGFTQHEYGMSTASGAAGKNIKEMNKGIGAFGYIGHGSGTAWNTPSVGVSQVKGLTNTDKPFFQMDCSCDNGGFQSHSPCLAEALLTSKGGAITTMMSAPTIDTCCIEYLKSIPKVLSSKKVPRAGPAYVTALMKANVLAKNDQRTQSYNVFGDPTVQLAFVAPPGPPPPPPTRYHCTKSTYTCALAQSGHSTEAKCKEACHAP